MSDTTTGGHLASWLLAQIAEDKAAVLEMIHSQFDGELEEVHRAVHELIREHPDAAAAFKFRLAECEAKRRIVGLHTPGDRDRDCPECTDRDYRGSAGMPLVWCDTLRLLALPYAGRDGYREAWRPQ